MIEEAMRAHQVIDAPDVEQILEAEKTDQAAACRDFGKEGRQVKTILIIQGRTKI